MKYATGHSIPDGLRPRHGLLLVCLGALAFAAAMLSAPSPPRPADRLPAAPDRSQPTSRETLARLQEIGAEVETDAAGRVRNVSLARRPISDDDMTLLADLPRLQSLNLRGIHACGGVLTDAGLRHLSGLTELRRLNLSANHRLGDVGLSHLRKLTRLERLDLSGTRITNRGLTHLQSMHRLRWLRVPAPTDHNGVLRHATATSGGVTQEGLVHLHGVPLEELHGVFLHDDGFRYLSGLTRLRRFPTDFSSPRDIDLPDLRDLKQLEALQISLSAGWSESSRLQHLRNLTGLRTVEIRGGSAANDAADWSGLAVLADLPHLERLRLIGVSDAALGHLPRLESLRILDLSHSAVSGSGLRHLNEFPGLEALVLNLLAITDDGLAGLRHLPHLRELRLDGRPYRGRGFAHMTPKPGRTDSADVQLTDEGLRHLQHTPNLRRVHLNRLPLTDAGLHHVRHLTGLEELGLDRTSITDAGLVELHCLNRLRELSFTETAISHAAAAELHQVLPACRIADNWCCGCMALVPTRQTP